MRNAISAGLSYVEQDLAHNEVCLEQPMWRLRASPENSARERKTSRWCEQTSSDPARPQVEAFRVMALSFLSLKLPTAGNDHFSSTPSTFSMR